MSVNVKFRIVKDIKKEVKVEKPTAAQLFFLVSINGVTMPVPSKHLTTVDGISLTFGENAGISFGPNSIQLDDFGVFSTGSPTEGKNLLAMAPKLESLFLQAAREMVAKHCETMCTPFQAKDLYTGLPIHEVVEPVAAFHFQPPGIQIETQTVQERARIYWMPGTLAPDTIVHGTADKLTIAWPVTVDQCGWDSAKNRLSFNYRGWIDKGVAEMRALFSDDVIKAAFQDLTKGVLEIDSTPDDRETWTVSSISKLELVVAPASTTPT